MLGGLLESGDVHVANARTNYEMQVYTVAGNFITDDVEFQRLVGAFTQNRDLDLRPPGPFEQISDIAGGHVVGQLAIHRNNYIARPDAGSISRSAHKRSNHNNFIVPRTNLHAHAVVFTALFLAQQRVGFRIKEVGVRIEHSQHSRNGAVIDGFFRVYLVGVVLFHHGVYLREVA